MLVEHTRETAVLVFSERTTVRRETVKRIIRETRDTHWRSRIRTRARSPSACQDKADFYVRISSLPVVAYGIRGDRRDTRGKGKGCGSTETT